MKIAALFLSGMNVIIGREKSIKIVAVLLYEHKKKNGRIRVCQVPIQSIHKTRTADLSSELEIILKRATKVIDADVEKRTRGNGTRAHKRQNRQNERFNCQARMTCARGIDSRFL